MELRDFKEIVKSLFYFITHTVQMERKNNIFIVEYKFLYNPHGSDGTRRKKWKQ